MKFKINLKPYPGANYFTVPEHQKVFESLKNKQSKNYMGSLQNNLRLLYNIPDKFKFYMFNLEAKQLLNNEGDDNFRTIIKDDPDTGIDLSTVPDSWAPKEEISFLDLSYSFPHVIQDYTHVENLIIDPNASLGIPSNLCFFFSQSDSEESIEKFESMDILKDDSQLYVLHKVVSDYVEKGKELLLRESNYKYAVLNQTIENSPHLKPVADKENRSKTMIVADCSYKILEQIEKQGFELEALLYNEKVRIIIANYPTHSKELVEMFSDRIAAL